MHTKEKLELIQEGQKEMYSLEDKVKTLTEKLLESFEELNILYDASQSLINIYNIKEICDITLTQITEIIRVRKASILLVDEDQEHLTTISCRGIVDDYAGQKIRINSTVYNDVINRQKPVLTENIDGQFNSVLKSHKDQAAPFILNSLCALPMIIGVEVIGIISLSDKADKKPFTARDIKFLLAIASQAAMAIQNARLITNLRESFLITVRSLSAAIDAKDNYTHGHSDRVSKYALCIGQTLGVDRVDLEQLELACLLHDVGKIGIPEDILNKKDKLSEKDIEVIRKHPIKGMDILKNTKLTKSILAAVRSHHEKYNGQGYPDGLAQEQIPFLARIISVADSYDAMVSDRHYRCRCSTEEAIEVIRKGSGSQYDPKVVWAFLKWITEKE